MRFLFRLIRKLVFWLVFVFALWFFFGRGGEYAAASEVSTALETTPNGYVDYVA